MDKQDINKLFNLLEQLYQGKKKSRDEVTMAIWTEVLKPWSYEQVRNAVIQRARKNRYTPDPSELTAFLPKVATYRETVVDRYAPPTPSELRSFEKSKAWQEEWHRKLHEKGLPTFHEAIESGMTCVQWNQMLAAAGVWE